MLPTDKEIVEKVATIALQQDYSAKKKAKTSHLPNRDIIQPPNNHQYRRANLKLSI